MTEFVAGFLIALLVCWLYSRWCRQHEIVVYWDDEEDE